MADSKTAKAAKVVKAAAKSASHAPAKGAKKAAKLAAGSAPSPEKERSQPHVGGFAIGAQARDAALTPAWAQEGDTLTTATGGAVDSTDNTSKVGPRGPALLQDFHLREKITHFDHERIPERVVHARGAGATVVSRCTSHWRTSPAPGCSPIPRSRPRSSPASPLWPAPEDRRTPPETSAGSR